MTTIQLNYSQQPDLLFALFKVLFLPRTGFKTNTTLPNIKASWNGAKADLDNFNKYLKCCSLEDREALNILYPHVIASRMHMNMLTRREFPIKLLGMLHLRNHIIQHQKISLSETFDVETEVTSHRIGKKGLEFDVTTILTQENERLWEQISTYFVRGKFGTEDPVSSLAKISTLTDGEQIKKWRIAKNLGKQYAKIVDDYNPIHMSALAAKLFGLKRDIAHGFCILATSLDSLPSLSSEESVRFDVFFKGPVFLGSQINLRNKTSTDSNRFDLYCDDNDRPSICGNIRHPS